jgi:PAS domain S-box-containing protein
MVNKPKILIVDDEKLNVELFESYLSKDYDIITAYNGTEALLQVEKTFPDLILLDIIMPGVNGFEVCKKLKSNEKTLNIPILIITSLNEVTDRVKAIESGADDFLNKPVEFTELRARVKSLLRIKQYYDMLNAANEKLLQLAEEKYKNLFDNANDAIIIYDTGECIKSWNPAAERIFGWEAGEVIGMKASQFMIPQGLLPESNQIVRKAVQGMVISSFDTMRLRKDGSEIGVSVTVSPIRNNKQVVIGISNIIRDITERKRSEEQVKKSLLEKETLLREIHHRVKNNMQIISSLLRLQYGYIKEKKYQEMYKDNQNRIISMSLIHEKLYKSQNFTNVDFNEYIKDLITGLFQSYGVNTGKIALNLDIKNVSLGVDAAIPCGLIVNELVTNSLKYAFPDNRMGEINVAIRPVDENMIEMVVRDNGIGIPADLDMGKIKSLGLHLVKILAENQLQGKMQINRNEGTEFQIKFKMEKQ